MSRSLPCPCPGHHRYRLVLSCDRAWMARFHAVFKLRSRLVKPLVDRGGARRWLRALRPRRLRRSWPRTARSPYASPPRAAPHSNSPKNSQTASRTEYPLR
eukprot:COSAG06_NODE_199_length_20418_cov_43.318421_10_plen_101_part_00